MANAEAGDIQVDKRDHASDIPSARKPKAPSWKILYHPGFSIENKCTLKRESKVHGVTIAVTQAEMTAAGEPADNSGGQEAGQRSDPL